MKDYLPPLSRNARRWFRTLGLIAALTALLWFVYALRSVFTPLVAALAIAYVLNPVVNALEYLGLRRLTAMILLSIVSVILLVFGGAIVFFQASRQAIDLKDDVVRYSHLAMEWLHDANWLQTGAVLDVVTASTTQPTTTQAEAVPSSSSQPAGASTLEDHGPAAATGDGPPSMLLQQLTPLLGEHAGMLASSIIRVIDTALTSVVNWVSIFVLLPMYAFFFLWRFNEIVVTLRDHLPQDYRPTIVRVVKTIDRAIADFFRGRLVVCMIIGLVSGIGWQLVGLKNGLLLGLLAGLFNLVPFMSLVVLPPALFFAYSDATQVGQPWFWPVVLAMGVYMFTQALESFVLTPTIESKSSGLHPITTVVALLIGGQLAGLLGMLLSIPIASTLKTLSAEWLMPEIRRLAGMPPGSPTVGEPAPAPAAEAVDGSPEKSTAPTDPDQSEPT